MNSPPSLAAIQDALLFVSPECEREQWAKIGMALKSELGGDGFALFDEWSQRAGDYNKQDVKDTWKSIKGGGGVRIATLFYYAKQNGRKGADSTEVSHEEQGQQKQRKNRQNSKEAEELKQKLSSQDRAKQTAIKQWGAAKEADNYHPYLKRKQAKAYGLKVAGDALLVPIVAPVSGEMWNLQTIYPEPRIIRKSKKPRDKDYIPGGRKEGLCHFIPSLDDDGPLCVVEGYVTGASVHEATGWAVYVAFDSGNLKHIAKALHEEYTDRKIVIAADHDNGLEVIQV